MSRSRDYGNDPEFKAWAARIHEQLVPMIDDSAIAVSLVPTGEADVKFAVELGLMIMLDKPILVVHQPGTEVPHKLLRVADVILELDVKAPDAQAKMKAALDQVAVIAGLEP